MPAVLAPDRITQSVILSGFVGFQVMDAITTHVGLAMHHVELNRVMGPIMSIHGELAAYAVKGTAIAILLALLMLLRRRRPYIWHAYYVAAWISALAVIANVAQLTA